MTKKTWIVISSIVLILLIAALVFSFVPTGKVVENKPIKMAYVSALSGPADIWGKSIQKGLDFAVNEINAKGGINGRPLQVIYEDDACDPSTGVTAFNKVIDVDQVKIVSGTVCSSVAMAVSKKTQENRVFYMATGATHPDVPKQGDLIFRAWVSDAYEARKLAQYAVQNLGMKKIAITYYNDNPAGIALKDNFKEVIEENGGSITDIDAYATTERDFRTTLTKIMQKNPDGIYMAAVPEQTPLIVNKARELGYKGKIFLYGPSALSEGIPEKIEDKSNIYYASPVDKKETVFWENYKKQTGEDADLLVALGYDSIKIIEYALEKCGENTDCMRDSLLALKDFQITRGKISYNSGDISGVEFEIKSL